MSNPLEISLTGFNEFAARLKNLSQTAGQEVVNEIQASGENIATAARERVPKDTGQLAMSISNAPLDNGTETVAQKEYAAYVEFGTGAMVDVPTGLEEYAIQFRGAGIRKVNLPARPFMFNSYFEEKPKLLERIKEKLDSK